MLISPHTTGAPSLVALPKVSSQDNSLEPTSAAHRITQLKDEFESAAGSGEPISIQAKLAYSLSQKQVSLINREAFLREAVRTAHSPSLSLAGLAGLAVSLSEQSIDSREKATTVRGAVDFLAPMATEQGNLWAHSVQQFGTEEQVSILLGQLAQPSSNHMAEGRELLELNSKAAVENRFNPKGMKTIRKFGVEMARAAVSRLPADHPERQLFQVASKPTLLERYVRVRDADSRPLFRPEAFLDDSPAFSVDKLSDKASQAVTTMKSGDRMLDFLKRTAQDSASQEVLGMVTAGTKSARGGASFQGDKLASGLISSGIAHVGRHEVLNDQKRLEVFRDLAAQIDDRSHYYAQNLLQAAEQFMERPDFKACLTALENFESPYLFPVSLSQALGTLAAVEDHQDPVQELWRVAAPEVSGVLDGDGEPNRLPNLIRNRIALNSLATDARDPDLRARALDLLKKG